MFDDDNLFWYLFTATKGGPNRLRIVYKLFDQPANAHNLAKKLQLDYKTIQHHLEVLLENGVVIANKEKRYGELYFLSPYTKSKKKMLKEIWHKIKNMKNEG